MTNYILDEHGQPQAEPDVLVWAKWFEEHQDRHIADDTVRGMRISTVFLGIDHNFTEDGPPVLWETMVFGGGRDLYQERYTSREEAVEGHKRALAVARKVRWWRGLWRWMIRKGVGE